MSRQIVKTVAGSAVVPTVPVSNVSPINSGKMGQDLDTSHPANNAPRIALIAPAKIDVSSDAGQLKRSFETA